MVAYATDGYERARHAGNLEDGLQRDLAALHVQSNLAVVRNSLTVPNNETLTPLGANRFNDEGTIARRVRDVQDMLATSRIKSELDVGVDPIFNHCNLSLIVFGRDDLEGHKLLLDLLKGTQRAKQLDVFAPRCA